MQFNSAWRGGIASVFAVALIGMTTATARAQTGRPLTEQDVAKIQAVSSAAISADGLHGGVHTFCAAATRCGRRWGCLHRIACGRF